MVKTFKYILKTLFLLSALALSAAAVDVESLIKSDVSQADYPLDESVVLYEGIHYTLYPDGRISQRVHRVRALFTENALDAHGDIFVNYRNDKQELKIERARGYLIDGAAADSYENAFNQITPRALGGAPDYLRFQEMVITHVGLEWSETSPLGSKSELIYTIEDKEPFQPWLEGIEYFQSGEYILNKEVKITAPAGTELHFKFFHGNGNLKQDVRTDTKTWTWTMSNVPHIVRDDAYHYRMNFTPTLIFSTCTDWKTASAHFAREIKSATAASESVKAQAEEAAEGVFEPGDIPLKLAEYVRKNVRTVNHSYDLYRTYHRDAERTLLTRYANPFDKAILLAAMLKTQGLPAEVALSAEVHQKDFTVPVLSNFDHFWVVTESGGKQLYLDPLKPLSSSSRKDLEGHAVFTMSFTGAEPVVVPENTPDDNCLAMKLKLEIADDGSYTGSGYFKAAGYFSPCQEVTADKDGAEGWLKGKMKKLLPNLEFEKGKAIRLCCHESEFQFEFKGEKLGETVRGYLTLNIPELPFNITALEPSGLHTSYLERSNPVFFKGPGSQSLEMTVEMPEKWSLAFAPKDLVFKSEVGSAIIKVEDGGKTLKFTIKESLDNSEVAPENFPTLKKLYQIRNSRGNRNLVFKTE